MDGLPPSLILEILSRLTDSADLARCRLVSKTFNALSREVPSISLICSLSRFLKSRSPHTRATVTPFKAIFNDLVLNSQNIHSVSIGIDKSLGGLSYDDVEDESDDLYLTGTGFVRQWLPKLSSELRCLSISDFWIQSCWRKSEILVLISSCCHRLRELEMKNAWLSVDGLNAMPTLTKLTLEFIRLEDEDLNKVNDCFPSLEVLNLIGVGGLKEPKIRLFHLRTCQWTVSNAPVSLAIHAPNLVNLKLICVKPKSLVLDTPLLSDIHLSVEKAYELRVNELPNLRNLHLESSSLCSLIGIFPCGRTIKKLTLESLKQTEPVEMGLEILFDAFPNVRSLSLCPRVWSEMETCFHSRGLDTRTGMKGLNEIYAHLQVHDIDATLLFIFSILDKCPNLSDVALFIHLEVDPTIARNLISRCTADRPRIRWRWGMWKEGMKDCWVSDGI